MCIQTQARDTATHAIRLSAAMTPQEQDQDQQKREPWAQQRQQTLRKWLALGLCGAEGSGRLGPGQPSSSFAAARLSSCQPPEGGGTADPWSPLQHPKQPQCALSLLAEPNSHNLLDVRILLLSNDTYIQPPKSQMYPTVQPSSVVCDRCHLSIIHLAWS